NREAEPPGFGASVSAGAAARPAEETRRTAALPAPGGSRVIPPWAAWMPPGAAEPGVDGERLCLLGVAVALHAAPATARSQGFSDAMCRWRIGHGIGPDRLVAEPSSVRIDSVPVAVPPGAGAAGAKPFPRTDMAAPAGAEVAARAALLWDEAIPEAAATAP